MSLKSYLQLSILQTQHFYLDLRRSHRRVNGEPQKNRLGRAWFWSSIEVARIAKRTMAAHFSARRKHLVALGTRCIRKVVSKFFRTLLMAQLVLLLCYFQNVLLHSSRANDADAHQRTH